MQALNAAPGSPAGSLGPYAMALAPSSIVGIAPSCDHSRPGRSYPQAPTLHHPAFRGASPWTRSRFL